MFQEPPALKSGFPEVRSDKFPIRPYTSPTAAIIIRVISMRIRPAELTCRTRFCTTKQALCKRKVRSAPPRLLLQPLGRTALLVPCCCSPRAPRGPHRRRAVEISIGVERFVKPPLHPGSGGRELNGGQYGVADCALSLDSTCFTPCKCLPGRTVHRPRPQGDGGNIGEHGRVYVESSVPRFLSASAMVSSGGRATTSALRTRQSRLLIWSARMTPAAGNPGRSRTSIG